MNNHCKKQRKSIKINDDQCKSMKINEKSMKINGKSMKINEDQWKSMKINKQQ